MDYKKFNSKLYKPNKPLHKMTIEELCNHNLVCQSLDKMRYSKIQKLEKLSDDKIQKKIKRFLERNKHKKTRKHVLMRKKTRRLKNLNGKTKKRFIKKRKSLKSKEIL